MFKKLVRGILAVPFVVVIYLAVVRIVRHFYKFPVPHFMVKFIDNPWRRSIQPPEWVVQALGLKPGMTVLEVGPGNGSYTLAAAALVGGTGQVISIDIQPEVIEGVRDRMGELKVTNVDARLGDVYALPFDDGSIDAAFMVTVIGEIPDPVGALREIRRVLKVGGKLACSELLLDPDYPLATTLKRWGSEAGLLLHHQEGNMLTYTVVFEKG